jgi:Abortive infection C-terminus
MLRGHVGKTTPSFVPSGSLPAHSGPLSGCWRVGTRKSSKSSGNPWLTTGIGDLEQAIGSAKELIESTAKLVLDDRSVAYSKNDDVTVLIHRAQEALGLSPAKAPTIGPDGGASIKRILGGASSVAIGVAELRNQYGTGHGQGRLRTGLGQRHAHLAVNAAFMWCQLMLETLADPNAPWRKQTAAAKN